MICNPWFLVAASGPRLRPVHRLPPTYVEAVVVILFRTRGVIHQSLGLVTQGSATSEERLAQGLQPSKAIAEQGHR